jgi:DNA invertase Pin-like site-specific DNA recombinase
MKIIVGYIRVSSRGQGVDSHALKQQTTRLKSAGATEIFIDIESGSKDDRPRFKNRHYLKKLRL